MAVSLQRNKLILFFKLSERETETERKASGNSSQKILTNVIMLPLWKADMCVFKRREKEKERRQRERVEKREADRERERERERGRGKSL